MKRERGESRVFRAVNALQQLVGGPGHYTKVWIGLDPTFVPLRGNPRFERLMAGQP